MSRHWLTIRRTGSTGTANISMEMHRTADRLDVTHTLRLYWTERQDWERFLDGRYLTREEEDKLLGFSVGASCLCEVSRMTPSLVASSY